MAAFTNGASEEVKIFPITAGTDMRRTTKLLMVILVVFLAVIATGCSYKNSLKIGVISHSPEILKGAELAAKEISQKEGDVGIRIFHNMAYCQDGLYETAAQSLILAKGVRAIIVEGCDASADNTGVSDETAKENIHKNIIRIGRQNGILIVLVDGKNASDESNENDRINNSGSVMAEPSMEMQITKELYRRFYGETPSENAIKSYSIIKRIAGIAAEKGSGAFTIKKEFQQ